MLLRRAHSGCLAYCEDEPNCHSFTLLFTCANDNSDWLLFSAPVTDDITVDDSSPWTFFDFDCPQSNQERELTGWSRNDSYVGL